MTEVIKEYGGMVLAVMGGFFLFAILGSVFLSGDGLLARMIQIWGNGGC